MKPFPARSGVTLLEMTVVIMVMLALIGTGLFVSKQWNDWQRGKAASEELRTVYAAQRLYLSDHPTYTFPSNPLITAAQLIPYLSNRATAIPQVKDLSGDTLNIDFTVSPPTIIAGDGSVYDPSDSSTDSLWDVGQ